MSRCGTAFADGSQFGEPRARPHLIDIDTIKQKAHDQVRSLAAELLPNGREECGYWRTGSIADDAGQSLAVTLEGPDRGMWCDYSVAKGTRGAGGNLIQLAAEVSFRGDVGEAIKWLKSYLGLDNLDPARLERVRAEAAVSRARDDEASAKAKEDKRRKAQGLFLRGEPINGTPAGIYLKGRGIDFATLGRVPNSLKYSAEIYNVEAKRKLPCLLACIVDLAGRHIATHRTWLQPDGRGGWTKADLEEPKKVLGSFKGGFIPLWKGAHRQSLSEIPAGTDVWASEGIEDGLSAAMAKPTERVIAAVTLGNLGWIKLPEQLGRYLIVGQRDTKPKTLEALEQAIALQQEAGVEVWLTPPPLGGFKDVNEALCAGEEVCG